MKSERILFVTGKLAEFALRRQLEKLSREVGFQYEVEVLGISVAALLHADWVRRKIHLTQRFDRVILPGWCQGEISTLTEQCQMPFELGPKDLFDLPEHFGQMGKSAPDLSLLTTTC